MKEEISIFLLRGLIREKRHWGPFVDSVKSIFPNAKIITPEIPGVGAYSHMASPTNFIDMVNFMREKIVWEEHKGRKKILLAMSLGGMMAREWVDHYPDDFDNLVLVNTSYKGINPFHHRLRPLSVLRFLKILMIPTVAMREKAIIQMSSNDRVKQQKHLDNWVMIQKDSPVSRANFFRQISAALKYKAPQHGPTLPTLILAGEQDRLCSVKCSRKIHQLWGGSLKTHPTAGHDIPIDDAEWILNNVKEWV
jgi:pimeloyl-ACP methyl ester carboxylesterase